MLQRGSFWFIVFLSIFLATQDYFFFNWTEKTAFLGFPDWLFYFFILHLVFVCIFIIFSKKYWKNSE